MTPDQRARAFLLLSRFTGAEVTSQFLRATRDHFPAAGLPTLHSLAQGIFKPAGDRYTLCVWSRSAAGGDTEVYPDVFHMQPDGSWAMEYAAMTGPLDSATNRSLFACMKDKVPLMVIVTSRRSGLPGGARYRILGPAILEDFDPSTRRFSLRGCTDLVAERSSPREHIEDAAVISLRNQLVCEFQVRESRPRQQAYRDQRNRAFRRIILDEYRCLCAVCQSKFLLREPGQNDLVEAEAAHIISVNNQGPDDPRNGISLCKRHHWAFDNGLFTVTDALAINVSPAVKRAERRRFDLEEYDGEQLVPPTNQPCRPHERALHWHQERVFRRA
jgi:HNH endonuclease